MQSEQTYVATPVQKGGSAIKRPYKLIEIIQETPSVKAFKFKSEFQEKSYFKPGQFVQIGYSFDGTRIDVQRPYSIASAPGLDTLEFYIEIVDGKLTSILNKAKIGDIFNISQPNGKNFEFTPSKNKRSLFIAAATGIAPFICMLRYIEQNRISENITLLYTVRTKQDIIRATELEDFARKGIAKVVITLTREENNPDWQGETGRIDAAKLQKYVPDITERVTYLCGSNQFNSTMTELLKSFGVPADKDHIKHDVW